MICANCQVDPVAWNRRRYCGAQCMRRAGYLRTKAREYVKACLRILNEGKAA